MTPLLRLKLRCVGAGLTGWLLLANPRLVRAGTVASYKYEDYREAGGRIAVQTQSALLEQDLTPDLHVKVTGVIDAIAGATPNGQPAPAGSDQVVLTEMHDRRKAWSAELAGDISPATLVLGVANSRESDYVSTGWSLNALTAFNQKNTTLRLGVAGTDDDVKVFYQPAWTKKRTFDFITGFTQLLDANTMVAGDFGWGRATGYLSDPYKLVQKSVEVAPGVFLPITYGENRPDWRDKWTLRVALNRAFADLHGALESSYRFYHDTFGTNAHTFELTWLQRLGAKFILQPELRLYEQSAADFYHYQLDQTSIVPAFGPPRSQGPFYSSDYRVSSLRTSTVGLKAVWQVAAHLRLDLALEQYVMRGRDGVTPQSAYPRATIVTAGMQLSW
ncbi:MAG TPA: DUF3570 domain-containing protein [Opitutaceae bacterium]|nr:DUF3570 domain-containing protein [Opitutaceae bacterium]